MSYSPSEDQKHPKTLLEFQSNSQALSIHPNSFIEEFDILFAVDTNTRPIDGKNVSMCVSVKCEKTGVTERIGNAPLVSFYIEPLINVLSHDVPGNPEIYMWWSIINHILNKMPEVKDLRVGLVVDSNLKMLRYYNNRSLPLLINPKLNDRLVQLDHETINGVIKTFLFKFALKFMRFNVQEFIFPQKLSHFNVRDSFLPENFTLIYANSSGGKDYLLNRLLGICHKEAETKLKKIEEGERWEGFFTNLEDYGGHIEPMWP